MLSVPEAQSRLLSDIQPLESLAVPLLDSLGATLAEAITADIDNPPFDNSAVDGFAVLASDTGQPPVVLNLVAEVSAGAVSSKSITSGTCVKIMTGAPLPRGADAVVMGEDTKAEGDLVHIFHSARTGDHVRVAGNDFRRGERVLRAGTLIGPAEIAMLAAVGRTTPKVIRRPRVAVITTGSEVIDVDRIPGPGQIRNSNGFALAALIAESGAHLHAQSHIPDDPAETESALRSAAGLDGEQGADIIITAGGVSVGDKDYVKPALEKLGTLSFWRVKMKPGKPIAVGRIGQSIFFGLPGNPISAMVTYELFARPAIRKLAGHSDLLRPRLRAGLEGTIAHTPGREEYVRAVVSASETGLIAQPAGAQGSGMLTSMVGANALIVVPADSGDIPSGSSVEVILLRLPGA